MPNSSGTVLLATLLACGAFALPAAQMNNDVTTVNTGPTNPGQPTTGLSNTQLSQSTSPSLDQLSGGGVVDTTTILPAVSTKSPKYSLLVSMSTSEYNINGEVVGWMYASATCQQSQRLGSNMGDICYKVHTFNKVRVLDGYGQPTGQTTMVMGYFTGCGPGIITGVDFTNFDWVELSGVDDGYRTTPSGDTATYPTDNSTKQPNNNPLSNNIAIYKLDNRGKRFNCNNNAESGVCPLANGRDVFLTVKASCGDYSYTPSVITTGDNTAINTNSGTPIGSYVSTGGTGIGNTGNGNTGTTNNGVPGGDNNKPTDNSVTKTSNTLNSNEPAKVSTDGTTTGNKVPLDTSITNKSGEPGNGGVVPSGTSLASTGNGTPGGTVNGNPNIGNRMTSTSPEVQNNPETKNNVIGGP